MYEIIKDGKIMPRLLECPFCKSYEKDVAVNDDDDYVISCEKCGATIWGKTLLEAATRWNTRGGIEPLYNDFTHPPLLWCKARRLLDDGTRGCWIWGYVRHNEITNCWFLETDKGDRFVIDPETVCEYTGLADAHQKPVYNGDIIARPDGNKRYNVSFFDGAFWVQADETGPGVNAPFTLWGMVHSYGGVVVGNRFDAARAGCFENDE